MFQGGLRFSLAPYTAVMRDRSFIVFEPSNNSSAIYQIISAKEKKKERGKNNGVDSRWSRHK